MFLHANSNNVWTHHYTSKHTHCCSGLALYNGIRDHHLPLLSRHFILPLLVHCLSITLIVTAPFLFHICFLMVLMWWHLSLTFLTICASYQSLNSCHIIPARSDSVKDLSLSILFYLYAIFQSILLAPMHPCLSFITPIISSGVSSPLPCSPVACWLPWVQILLRKRLGWEFNCCTTRIEPDQPTKRQNHSPFSSPSLHASASSLALFFFLPLAIILGDKGLFVGADSSYRIVFLTGVWRLIFSAACKNSHTYQKEWEICYFILNFGCLNCQSDLVCVVWKKWVKLWPP